LARELQLEDSIWFTGWIDDCERYIRYLNTADICVSPEPPNDYNNRSTFVKIMEYMAAGKPIVAFDLPESRFSAQDCALYVRDNDEKEFAVQLARLIEDPLMRHELGKRGQNRIHKELAWQYSVPKLLSVYDECLEIGAGVLSDNSRIRTRQVPNTQEPENALCVASAEPPTKFRGQGAAM